MKSELISLFIDDELDLDDKVSFVETVHAEAVFKDETIELLNQEKMLRLDGVERVPEVLFKAKTTLAFSTPASNLSIGGGPGRVAAVSGLFNAVPGKHQRALSLRHLPTGCDPGRDCRKFFGLEIDTVEKSRFGRLLGNRPGGTAR